MEKKCIFCGKKQGEAKFFITGPDNDKVLCNECVAIASIIANQAYLEMESESASPDAEDIDTGLPLFEDTDSVTDEVIDEIPDFSDGSVKDEPKSMLTPIEVRELLDKQVIGQDKVKKVLAVAMYNHLKRLNDKSGLIRKSNIMMVGSSGTGKTLLAQTLADILDVPFAIADATSLTEAGYVGDDVENILVRLLNAADGDISRAEKGIIYIDEVDKIARKGENRSITRDVSGEGVQHALLKIIEGADVSVPVQGGRKHPRGGNIMMNTKNILFICGGAFEGLGAQKSEEKKKSIGFGFNNDIQIDHVEEAEVDDVCPDDLVKYGMTPELMGRLPIIIRLDDLDEGDLVRILTEPAGALTKEYKELLAADGVELVFEDEALNEIAKIAIKRNTGARGLRSIMEDIMTDIMYTIPSEKNIKKCIITKDTVYTKLPKLRKRRAA